MTERELFKAISDLIGDRPDNSPIWEVGEDNDGQIIIYTGLTYADRDGNLKHIETEGATNE